MKKHNRRLDTPFHRFLFEHWYHAGAEAVYAGLMIDEEPAEARYWKTIKWFSRWATAFWWFWWNVL